jgi:protein-tyrosine phosphatase
LQHTLGLAANGSEAGVVICPMGIVLLAVGVVQMHEAVARGGSWVLLAWSGAAFALAGVAHVAEEPRLLGKRTDGRMDTLLLLALLPYLLVTWGRWQLEWRLSRENCWDEVAPGLFVGRWPGAGGLPAGVGLVVDMTAELPRASCVARVGEYVCLPTLDTTSPDPRRFAEVARRAAAAKAPVYVHCALGHGRAALMAAAVLLSRELAASASEAVERLRAARPRVRLAAGQYSLLERFARERHRSGGGCA